MVLRLIRLAAASALFAIAACSAVLAQVEEEKPELETVAEQALIVDGETGAILFEKNPDQPFPPASLAKMMTMEIVFDALKSGEISPNDTFPVSEHAWRTGGAPSGSSTMFAEVRSQIPVDALIRGTIVQSANDATIVIAEGMSGSEAEFAERMNVRAGELGLSDSAFVNPSGLPAEGQQVTARDLVRLARHIEATYPELYRIYSQPDFEWNGIFQRNRNPLLSMDIGASGIGTGATEEAGYSLVGVTNRSGRETFIALGGLDSEQQRAEEAKRLLDWANDAFERKVLFEAGSSIGNANVYGGVGSAVPLVARDGVVAFLPKDDPQAISAHIRYDAPLRAPVEEGARVGQIEIWIDERVSVVEDLYAGAGVNEGTFAARALDAAQELAFGWIRAL